MSELREYFSERADIVDVVEVRTLNGGVNYFLKIDGTYSTDAADGMLEYHRNELLRVLKAEGIELGVRFS